MSNESPAGAVFPRNEQTSQGLVSPCNRKSIGAQATETRRTASALPSAGRNGMESVVLILVLGVSMGLQSAAAYARMATYPPDPDAHPRESELDRVPGNRERGRNETDYVTQAFRVVAVHGGVV